MKWSRPGRLLQGYWLLVLSQPLHHSFSHLWKVTQPWSKRISSLFTKESADDLLYLIHNSVVSLWGLFAWAWVLLTWYRVLLINDQPGHSEHTSRAVVNVRSDWPNYVTAFQQSKISLLNNTEHFLQWVYCPLCVTSCLMSPSSIHILILHCHTHLPLCICHLYFSLIHWWKQLCVECFNPRESVNHVMTDTF